MKSRLTITNFGWILGGVDLGVLYLLILILVDFFVAITLIRFSALTVLSISGRGIRDLQNSGPVLVSRRGHSLGDSLNARSRRVAFWGSIPRGSRRSNRSFETVSRALESGTNLRVEQVRIVSVRVKAHEGSNVDELRVEPKCR